MLKNKISIRIAVKIQNCLQLVKETLCVCFSLGLCPWCFNRSTESLDKCVLDTLYKQKPRVTVWSEFKNAMEELYKCAMKLFC
jgi:hypothetical protein